MNRLYDQPDHHQYGPVRRLHVILLQVYADVGLERLDELYEEEFMDTWDNSLAWFIDHGLTEPDATRIVIGRCLETYGS